jgi:hypothetical protein
MFTGSNAAAAPVAKNIQNGFIQNPMGKFGLDGNRASSIVANLLPSVLNQFVNKTNDSNDNNFDLHDIMQKLSGSNGGLEVQNIISQFQGGNGGSSGLRDTVKGLFK